MFNFFQSFEPSPVLLSLGFVNIHYYGLFIALAVLVAFFLTLYLAKRYAINKDDIINLSFYLIIFGIIGARVYDVLLEWPYYLNNPLAALKIWKGGLAIHGGIIAGIIVLLFFIKKKKIKGLKNKNLWEDFVTMLFIITPGLALGQAIGRWGNYFNQELFGLPTQLPWGIPISVLNRPIEYISYNFFHPAFLYESLGSLLIFTFLIIMHQLCLKKKKNCLKIKVISAASYLILYSILRFLLEFIRIDYSPEILGLRFPQIMSLIIILLILLAINYAYKRKLI
jgi:phosphatidylglycerol---prolipoprotein diacylglyceryl transferase